MHLHRQKINISTRGTRERIKQNYSKDTEACMSKAQIDNASKITLPSASLHSVCAKKYFFTFYYVAAQKNYRFLLQSLVEHFCFKKGQSALFSEQSINMKLNEISRKKKQLKNVTKATTTKMPPLQNAHMKKSSSC